MYRWQQCRTVSFMQKHPCHTVIMNQWKDLQVAFAKETIDTLEMRKKGIFFRKFQFFELPCIIHNILKK